MPFVEGAVYSPEEEIVPEVADHVAGKFDVNCWVAPTLSDAVVGDTVSD